MSLGPLALRVIDLERHGYHHVLFVCRACSNNETRAVSELPNNWVLYKLAARSDCTACMAQDVRAIPLKLVVSPVPIVVPKSKPDPKPVVHSIEFKRIEPIENEVSTPLPAWLIEAFEIWWDAAQNVAVGLRKYPETLIALALKFYARELNVRAREAAKADWVRAGNTEWLELSSEQQNALVAKERRKVEDDFKKTLVEMGLRAAIAFLTGGAVSIA